MLANIKNNQMTRAIVRKYLDYLEDLECLRLAKPNSAKALVYEEMMKLVPENYKISLLPAFFNHTDGDRIGTVIRDTSHEFLVETPKKVMFSIGVKIFPYASEINSVRVVLVKFHELAGAETSEGDGDGRSASRRSRSRKSGSQRSRSNKSRSKSKASGSQKGDVAQDVPPKK